ncbi:hypothetical protein FB470_005987 [Amycolatopsis thermophila]|uniref:Uncharacterized protein n=1 Tax=Amycolatopsis thermophila TaxID=206084 RepID=A0ABU0F332_9PSEU|nr:hypothetical protein [Amycolatopsis thermophila]
MNTSVRLSTLPGYRMSTGYPTDRGSGARRWRGHAVVAPPDIEASSGGRGLRARRPRARNRTRVHLQAGCGRRLGGTPGRQPRTRRDQVTRFGRTLTRRRDALKIAQRIRVAAVIALAPTGVLTPPHGPDAGVFRVSVQLGRSVSTLPPQGPPCCRTSGLRRTGPGRSDRHAHDPSPHPGPVLLRFLVLTTPRKRPHDLTSAPDVATCARGLGPLGVRGVADRTRARLPRSHARAHPRPWRRPLGRLAVRRQSLRPVPATSGGSPERLGPVQDVMGSPSSGHAISSRAAIPARRPGHTHLGLIETRDAGQAVERALTGRNG